MNNLYNSIYNVEIDCGKKLRVFNSLWKSIIEFDKEKKEFELFNQIKNGRIFSEKNTDKTDIIEQLINQKIITPYSKDLQIQEATNRLTKIQKRNQLVITYGVTFECNFSCIYCIQHGNYNTHPKLSTNILNKSYQFAKNYLQSFPIESLYINLFGGEPTLEPEIINNIINSYLYIAKEYSLKGIQFQLVTNGYELDKLNFSIVTPENFDVIQITIDGTSEYHNKRRLSKKHQPTFDKVFSNMINLLENKYRIALLTVVDKENLNCIIEFIEFIDDYINSNSLNKMKSNLELYIFPVIPSRNACKRNKEVFFGSELQIENRVIEARKFAKQKGFIIGDIITVDICFRELEHSLLIDPTGDIYKCYSVFGDKKYSLGNINESLKLIKKKMDENSKIIGFESDCNSCAIFPLCRGGCQYRSSLVNNGLYGKKFCQKNFITKVLKENIINGIF